MESKKAGSYDKDVHVKLKAMTHRGKHDYVAPSTITKDTPGAYLDTRTGKWRLPAPDGTTPGKATTTTVDASVYDPSAFKGKLDKILVESSKQVRRENMPRHGDRNICLLLRKSMVLHEMRQEKL
jgi:hypothetical protein